MDKNIKKQFKGLNFIYMVILGSMSIAAMLSVFVVSKVGAVSVFELDQLNVIKAVVIMALLTGIPVSHIFYYKKIKHINSSFDLSRKISIFRTAFIVRIAMLEGIGLLCLIGHLITADKSFLYMFAVVFILFIIHAPTKQRISSDLELSEEDGDLLK